MGKTEAIKMQFETARLLLRAFQEGDVDDCLEYRNDAEFARYLPHIPQPFTRSDAAAFVQQNMTEPFDTSPTFALVLEGKVIGTVNLEIDLNSKSAMLGYAIGRSYWGHGIAVEAAERVLAWAFGDLKLERIWASTDKANLQSMRVMEKLSMSPKPSTTEPTFAITKEEWERRTSEISVG